MPCANPTNVSASDGENARVTITFTMPISTSSECVIRRSTNSFPTSHTAGSQVGTALTGDGSPITAGDTGLTNGTIYLYAVYCRCLGSTSWNDTLDIAPPGVNGDAGQPQAPLPPQVVFDAAAYKGEHNSSTSLSYTHTIGGGTNRLLLASLVFGESAWQPTPTVTFAGQVMTLLIRRDSANTSQAVWSLVNPPVGTHTVSATGLSPSVDGKTLGSVSFSNVNPTQPLGPHASAIGTGNTPSVSVASGAGEIVVDFLSLYNGVTSAAGPGQTSHWTSSQGLAGLNPRLSCSSRKNGSATTSFSWSVSDALNWAIIAVPVRP